MGKQFTCAICGQVHEGLPTAWGFKLPDVVWEIPEQQRADAARFTDDLCQFGERFFIRGVLPVPFAGEDGEFGWGAWAEVDEDAFDRYLQLYDVDASNEPAHAGKLANKLPGFDHSEGLRLFVQFQSKTQRPTFSLPPQDRSPLALEQRNGIDNARFHQILDQIGLSRAPPKVGLWHRIWKYLGRREEFPS